MLIKAALTYTVNAVIIVKYYVKCESVKVIVFYLYIFSSVMYSHDGKDTFILISNVENSCAAWYFCRIFSVSL